MTSFTEELVAALRKKRREPNCWVRALVSLVGLAVTLFEAATDETSTKRNKRWGQNENEIIGIISGRKRKAETALSLRRANREHRSGRRTIDDEQRTPDRHPTERNLVN